MITTNIETITPEKAQKYLERNVRNRVINSRSVDALVRDIKAGSFYLTHQGIAFYDDGTLADGQHRLTAIVLAGLPVQMMVTRGMPHDAKIAIDYGIKRRFEDALDIEENCDDVMLRNSRVIGMIRAMWRMNVSNTAIPTNHEIQKVLNILHGAVGIMYRASISRTRPPVGMVNAAGLAAAINGVSEEDLHSFFSVFSYGDSSESEGRNISAAYNWSKKLTEARLRHITINREQIYKGTQNAIWQYVVGDALKTIKVPKHDRYPVKDLLENILKGE